ncbi:MAG: hypothetical protein EA424_12330 [Planctomycetaceae bacterium]|nr:MAG: hypothetical protein EA424_12330 [Planctomycetaceae bacterium]
MAEVLDSLPPLLQITDDPDQATDRDVLAPREGEYGLAPLDGETVPKAAPAFSIDSSRDVSATAPTTAAKRRKGPVRPQRKKKNPAAEVVKIALGGIAGLVIAQLLLWWMPWQDLRRDPFALGPSISKFAPWLVPTIFHGGREVGSLPTDETPLAAANMLDSELPQPKLDQPIPQDQTPSPRKPVGQAPDAEPQTFDSDANEDPFSAPTVDPFDATAELPSIPPPAALDDDLLTLEPDMDWGADIETDPPLNIETDPPLDIETDPPDLDLANDSSVEPTADDAQPVRHLVSAPLFATDDLIAALEPIQPEFEALSVAGTDEAVSLTTRNYTRFTELAEKIIRLEDLESPVRDEAAGLLLSLVEKPDVIPRLRQAGEVWWAAGSRRTNDGILLVGKVRSIVAQDPLYRTELELVDGGSVASYSDNDPSEQILSGDLVLLVGVVIEEPADHLLGYSGDDQQVLWAPLFRSIPE